jgi:threonylcarbamoyladenosine tRNA methylthiotransferase MtaB
MDLKLVYMENKLHNVHTYTFGCKVNFYDTSQMEAVMQRGDQAVVDHQKSHAPDAIVINTCTVTESADKQARQLIRKLKREHPLAKIVVTGCYAQENPGEIQAMDEVNAVVPIRAYPSLPQVLGWQEQISTEPVVVTSQRTRANLKIQDGCNAYCSFCIIPYVRGKSTSIEMPVLLHQASQYVAQGHQELVITGTHIAGYGRDLKPRLRLSDVLYQLVRQHPDIALRISSLEPVGLTPDFFKALRDIPNVRPHFHIPLQSGSDDVLKKMNRKYKVQHYQRRIETLHAIYDRVNIGSDVIVGFPGETKRDFDQTVALVETLPMTYLHVFPYSQRPGTKANQYEETVSVQEKKRRVRTLRTLSEQKKQAFYQQFSGETHSVLVEKKRNAAGLLKGYTPHYLPVQMAGGDRLMEKEVQVRLEQCKQDDKGQWYFEAVVL